MSPASYLTAPPRVAGAQYSAATLRSMRVGGVDLATNSTRLLVAAVHGGPVAEVARVLDARTLVLDVGGGSTELILDGERTSLDIGSVRLTERFLHSDPPTGNELAAAAGAVALPTLDPASAIGVAGTVTTLAALELGEYDRERVHGYRITRETVERQLGRLASLPLSQRRELPGLEPERAPVIVGGALI